MAKQDGVIWNNTNSNGEMKMKTEFRFLYLEIPKQMDDKLIQKLIDDYAANNYEVEGEDEDE